MEFRIFIKRFKEANNMKQLCSECKYYGKRKLREIIRKQQDEINTLQKWIDKQNEALLDLDKESKGFMIQIENDLKLKQQIESAYWVIDDLVSQDCYDILENKYVNQFLSAQEHAWSYMKKYYPEKYKELYKDFETNNLEFYEILCDPAKWKKEI